MIREQVIYFTKVDKGGAIIILDSKTVDTDIRSILDDPQKYEKMDKDPRERIRGEIIGMVDCFVEDSVITVQDRLYLTGKTEKGGFSHDPTFCVRAPYVYPLYKLHKLSKQQIEEKSKLPNRMVTSSTNGPTYRLGVFLDHILKPVATAYCHGELVKDTSDFLGRMESLSAQGEFSAPGLNLVAMDICALYPNIKIDVALTAVEHALNTQTAYSTEEITAILKMLSYTLNNSVVHYRGNWYLSKEGAPTGNPEIPAVANIFVKFVCDTEIFIHETVEPLNQLSNRSRFLDDIWSKWWGTVMEFSVFLEAVNKIGIEFGVTFTGECGTSVEFLDVTTKIKDGCIVTNMYVKPTDCTRYLNRRSFHAKHTFTGMPFSQFRRAAVICSDLTDRELCIQRMEQKFLDSGYKQEDLFVAREKALSLDRASLLNPPDVVAVNDSKVLACVIYQDPGLRKELSSFFKAHEKELRQLLGDVKFVISERRHANIASMLFQKAAFSQNQICVRENQKCGSKRCKTEANMNLSKTVVVNGVRIKLDFRYTCASKSIIYLAICKLCNDPLNESNFYFGQSVNSLISRSNGHRANFKLSSYDKSALSMHIYDKHPEAFEKKLLSFDFGVVKCISPALLNRWEDYFIHETVADIKGLNRYKVFT